MTLAAKDDDRLPITLLAAISGHRRSLREFGGHQHHVRGEHVAETSSHVREVAVAVANLRRGRWPT
jgi:hypothetical protein